MNFVYEQLPIVTPVEIGYSQEQRVAAYSFPVWLGAMSPKFYQSN